MALTANTLPSVVPGFAVPFDALNAFAEAQTITSTGYVNNLNAVLDIGLGRVLGMLNIDISALDITSGDEKYTFHLFGSNDASFANGNVESLAVHDFAYGAAGRIVATILGAQPTIPPANASGTVVHLPFTNLMQGIVYRYLKCYVVIAGTTPTVTLTAWISPLDC